MELTFLGTQAMMPTKHRNASAAYLEFKGEGLLFDCAEGTQRQLKQVGVALSKIRHIFISHWHGDHVLGLPGMIQSLGAADFTKTLMIYGPPGTKKLYEHMMQGTVFANSVATEFKEVRSEKVVEGKNFSVECTPLNHVVPCVGYSFKEEDRRRIDLKKVKKLGIPPGPELGKLQQGKSIMWKGKKVTSDSTTYVVVGKKVVYVVDTAPAKEIVKLAKDADAFICEGTFGEELQDRAHEYKHLTVVDAATFAKKAKVKHLYLTHFSPRYPSTKELEKQAKKIFANTTCAKDLLQVKL
ncbi:MAG: ribonuclease Z [Candidatus Woesearchaeota archaeon]|nr:ribonuclease Z [Candidatus Woesearchaeota archaeon]MDP7181801.1 ribonuclease Z [Candidatus Woesearchaeota archaeon]MDP7198890.1 ribonuclease Z [Candidatus Woesearchaeota archaeon]MDP7467110.1 ribonuclease Z [Candidatus Woesearchaeota archaeon]MDP7647555.1 ribonuclease Z [Candidatus Woesearchaeota archaeon]